MADERIRPGATPHPQNIGRGRALLLMAASAANHGPIHPRPQSTGPTPQLLNPRTLPRTENQQLNPDFNLDSDSTDSDPDNDAGLEETDLDTVSDTDGSTGVEDQKVSRTLIVRGTAGFPPNILEMYFENRRIEGGTVIDLVPDDEDDDMCLITFEDKAVVERLLKRTEPLKLGEKTFTIEKVVPPDPRRVCVSGITRSISADVLQFYLESKRTGGGEVVSVEIDDEQGEAIVTFQDVEVVQRLLQSDRQHTIGDAALSITPVTSQQSQPETPDPRTVMVTGIAGMPRDILYLCLETEKCSGGGDIESLEVNDNGDHAIVTYEELEIARRVLGKRQVIFEGKTLSFVAPRPKKPQEKKKSSQKFNTAKESVMFPMVNTVEVHNIPQSISRQHLRLCLEKNAGGEVKDIDINREKRKAVVKFNRGNDAASLLQTGTVVMEGLSCQVIALDTTVLDDPRYEGPRAIKVTQLSADTPEDMIESFFGNRRRSGGYNVQNIFYEATEGKAVITLEATEAVESILSKHNSEPLSLNKSRLTLEKMEPPPAPKLVTGCAEPYKLLINNFPSALREELQAFIKPLNNASGIAVKKLLYSTERGIVIAEFSSMPDFDELQWLFFAIPFKDKMISAQKIPIPTGIQVNNVKNLNDEDLILHFESERHGGGEIEDDIQRVLDDEIALIDFKNLKVVKQVLQLTHRIKGQPVQAAGYYPDFGVVPSDYDPFRPWDFFPDPFMWQNNNPHIFHFLMMFEENKNLVKAMCKDTCCELDFDQSSPDEFHVRCTSEAVKSKQDWEIQARQTILNITSTIKTETITTLSEVFPDVLKHVEIIVKNTMVLMKTDEEHSMIILTGWTPDVDKIMDQVNPHSKDLEKKHNWNKESVVQSVQIQEHESDILKMMNFQKGLSAKMPSLVISVNKGVGIELKGLVADVNSAKIQIYEFNNSLKSLRFGISKGKANLLSDRSSKVLVYEEFQKKKINASVSLIQHEVTLWSPKQSDLARARSILDATVVEKEHNLTDESLSVLQMKEWEQFRQHSLSVYSSKVYISEDIAAKKIVISAIYDVLDPILETAQNLLDEHSTLTRFIPLSRGKLRLIDEYHKNKIQRVVENFQASGLSLTTRYENSPGFELKGNKYVIESALQAMEQITGQVIHKRHELNKPGMLQFFTSTKGRDALDTTERKFSISCEVGDDSEDVQNELLPEHKSIQFGSAKEVWSICLPNKCSIRVLCGDMTKHKVDAIVNAANTKMAHAGGLAGAIVKEGGASIQTECDKYIKKNGEMLTGQVFLGKAGKLPCKRIVHAVGPMWKGGMQNEPNELYQAIFDSLSAAAKENLQSIAFPAVSTGIFGYPLDKATKIICDTVITFLDQENSSVKEVHLMDNSDKCVASFTSALKASMKSKFPQMNLSAEAGKLTSKPSPKPKPRFSYQRPARPPSVNTRASARMSSSTSDIIATEQTAEGITMTVKKGLLQAEQVDVIVNTTTHDFQLNSGGVSGAILQAAGPGIQQECFLSTGGGKYPQGTIIPTSGGNLPVQKICHGSCGNWDNGKGKSEKLLRMFIQNCLNHTSSNGLGSIAFPAIGTGNNSFPRKLVAKWMKEELIKFSASNTQTSVRDVRIVLFPADTQTIESFEKVLGATVPSRPPERNLANSSTNQKGRISLVADTAGIMEARFGSVSFTLKKGDITKEQCDAIVNSTNSALDLSQAAVSKAISKAGGPTVQAECDQYVTGMGLVQDLAMTGAGNLPCQHIIHLNAPQGSSDWEKLILQMLLFADSVSLGSVALPALGTGAALKRSPTVMADVILKAVLAFALQNTPQNVQEISVVVFDDKIFNCFKDQMVREITGKGQGLLKQFFGMLKDIFSTPHKGSSSSSSSPLSTFGASASGRLTLTEGKQQSVVFQIYGFSDGNISNAISKLDDIVESATDRHVFDDPDTQNCIASMTEEQIMEVWSLMERYEVDIKIELKQRINRIIVDGLTKDVLACVTEINKIIAKVQKSIDEEKTADMFYQQGRWQFESKKGVFKDYSPQINYLIQKAKLDKSKDVTWEEDTGKYMIIFDKEVERQVGKHNSDVTVRYTTMENATSKSGNSSGNTIGNTGTQFPSTWTPMKPGEKFRLDDVPSNSQEFSNVMQKFSVGRIRKLQRVQNPELYELYALKKRQMSRALQNNINEMQLYHGTAEDAAKNIYTHGMNRSYSGKNATAYGDGVYFAVNAQYSARPQYARPNNSGQRFIFQCDVLAGEYTNGGQGMMEPPLKNQMTGLRYNSVVDNPANPTMFIIFHDAQAYPHYLITF